MKNKKNIVGIIISIVTIVLSAIATFFVMGVIEEKFKDVTDESIENVEETGVNEGLLTAEEFTETMESKYEASISDITESYNYQYGDELYEGDTYNHVLYASMEYDTLIVIYESFATEELCDQMYEQSIASSELDEAVLEINADDTYCEMQLDTEFWRYMSHSKVGNTMVTTLAGSLTDDEQLEHLKEIVKELGY